MKNNIVYINDQKKLKRKEKHLKVKKNMLISLKLMGLIVPIILMPIVWAGLYWGTGGALKKPHATMHVEGNEIQKSNWTELTVQEVQVHGKREVKTDRTSVLFSKDRIESRNFKSE